MYLQINKHWAFSRVIVSGFIVLSSAELLMLNVKKEMWKLGGPSWFTLALDLC